MAAKRKNKCNHCGKSYAKTESMNLHVKKVHKGLKIKTTVHKGTKQFSCTFCDKKYTQAHNLKSHIKIVHEGQKAEKVYKCSSCDRSFTQSHSLKSHMKSHGPKNNVKSSTTSRGKLTKKSKHNKYKKIESKYDEQKPLVQEEIKNYVNTVNAKLTKESPKNETLNNPFVQNKGGKKVDLKYDTSDNKDTFVHEETKIEANLDDPVNKPMESQEFESSLNRFGSNSDLIQEMKVQFHEKPTMKSDDDQESDDEILHFEEWSKVEWTRNSEIQFHGKNVMAEPEMADADYQCNLCPVKFNYKDAKIQHISDVHGYFKDITNPVASSVVTRRVVTT